MASAFSEPSLLSIRSKGCSSYVDWTKALLFLTLSETNETEKKIELERIERVSECRMSDTWRASGIERETLGRLRERAKRDESDSGDGSGNVSGAGLDPTGSGHSSRRVRDLWLAHPIESDSRQILTFFFDSVGLWTASTSDSVVGLSPFDSEEFGLWTAWTFTTAWTFSVEMSGSSCSASGQPTPNSTPSSCSFTSLSRKIIKSKSQWTQTTKLMHTTTTSTRRTCSCMQFACGSGKHGNASMRHFFWRHTRLRLVTGGLTSFLLVTSASRVTSVWLVLVSFRVFSLTSLLLPR